MVDKSQTEYQLVSGELHGALRKIANDNEFIVYGADPLDDDSSEDALWAPAEDFIIQIDVLNEDKFELMKDVCRHVSILYPKWAFPIICTSNDAKGNQTTKSFLIEGKDFVAPE